METFETLGVQPLIQTTLCELGYEAPTAIQAQSIPKLLEGRNILAQAQTGTGKTAAFALPILNSLIDPVSGQLSRTSGPRAIVLTPTRELAIQVAEAFQSYAKKLKGFHVLPIYGGQDFRLQLKALKRGVHVIVGTPGRMMDHLRKKTIIGTHMETIVLDEADEMLNMGFLEDVEWILEQLPTIKQTALFSATMPHSIIKVANKYLKDPHKIQIQSKTNTVESIKQFYTMVSHHKKLDVLSRFLDVEQVDAAIIFTRTKNASSELAEKLQARGYSADAINGDMSQDLREKVITRLKRGTIDIAVATDVAARGIDVKRVSHVFNYDIPHDPESYIHRIGRTGRAGREGSAFLFVTPKERRMLGDIERATKQPIKAIEPPTKSELVKKRQEKFSAQIIDVLNTEKLHTYRELIEKIVHEHESSELDIAAALAYLAQKTNASEDEAEIIELPRGQERSRGANKRSRESSRQQGSRESSRQQGSRDGFEEGMTRCRIAVGREQDIQPGNIVEFIAKHGKISGRNIGKIRILKDHSLVDLEDSVADKVIDLVYHCELKQCELRIAKLSESPRKPRKKEFKHSKKSANPASKGKSRKPIKPKKTDKKYKETAR